MSFYFSFLYIRQFDADFFWGWENPIWVSLALISVVVILIVSFLKYLIWPQQKRLLEQHHEISKLTTDRETLSNQVTELNTHLSYARTDATKLESSYAGLDAQTEARFKRLDRALHDFGNFINSPLMSLKVLAARLNQTENRPESRELIDEINRELSELKEYVPQIREEFKSGTLTGKFWALDLLLPKPRTMPHLSLEVTGNRTCRVYTHKETADGLVANLLSNALRFGATRILITIEETPREIHLQFFNNGDPLTREADEKLFRVPYTSGGTGHLFTSLMELKSIHPSHKAEVLRIQLPDQYTTGFRITFPAIRDFF